MSSVRRRFHAHAQTSIGQSGIQPIARRTYTYLRGVGIGEQE